MVSILSALSFAVGVDLSLAVDDDLSIIMQSANLCDHPQMGIAPSRQQARDHWVMSAPLMHERMTLCVSESRADGRETHHDISHRCSCTERGGHKWEPSGEIPSILVFLSYRMWDIYFMVVPKFFCESHVVIWWHRVAPIAST